MQVRPQPRRWSEFAVALRKRDCGNTLRTANRELQFSRHFIEVIAKALVQGHISLRKVAALLDVPTEGLSERFSIVWRRRMIATLAEDGGGFFA